MTDWKDAEEYTEDYRRRFSSSSHSKIIRNAVRILSSNETIGKRAGAYAVLTEHIHSNSLRLQEDDARTLFETLKNDLCSHNEVAVQNAFSFLLTFIPMEHGKSYAKKGVLTLVSTLVSLLGNSKIDSLALVSMSLHEMKPSDWTPYLYEAFSDFFCP